jgi:hypothetical protein
MDMSRFHQEGPPWGGTVDEDEMYLRGQAGQAGSGLLGGWSQASYGGALEIRNDEHARREREVRRTVAELAEEHPPKLGPNGED